MSKPSPAGAGFFDHLTDIPFHSIEVMWSGRLATAPDRSYAMSTSPNLHLTGPVNRDIFDSLESCEKLLTAREVARILSISEKTVYSYVSRNLIPHYKIEANVRFRARDIANWLRRHASLIQPVMASRKAAVRT